MLESLIQIDKFAHWWNGLADPSTPKNDAQVLHWAAETLPLVEDLPYECQQMMIFQDLKLFLEWLPEQTPEFRAASRSELSEMMLYVGEKVEELTDWCEQTDAMED